MPVRHHPFLNDMILYWTIRATDNGKKLIKDFEGERLVTELDFVRPTINELLEFFRKYEDSGKTVSCRGIDYFGMKPVTFRNGLYAVTDKISLPPIYHTNDERFNAFREGLF